MMLAVVKMLLAVVKMFAMAKLLFTTENKQVEDDTCVCHGEGRRDGAAIFPFLAHH